MNAFVRIIWIVVIFSVTTVGWFVLGGVMSNRTSQQEYALSGKVADLWGTPQSQPAPTLSFHWKVEETVTERVRDPETKAFVDHQRIVVRDFVEPMHLAGSTIEVDLDLDARRKGLLWFSLYDVDFEAAYHYTHRGELSGNLEIIFPFPESSGLYDHFRFAIDGEVDEDIQPDAGMIRAVIPVEPGQEVDIAVGYRSRGADSWSYVPSQGIAALNDFTLNMTTDFGDIDFPAYTLSPSSKTQDGEGWALTWAFDRVVTGHGVGMTMPERIQPGLLAQQMSFSAPISLGFFFLILFVLSVLKKIPIHPINYMLLAGAFFAFHLLFAYSADHLPVEGAFALSALTSMALVVSYLRLVVGSKFAFGPAAVAQLIYLVGFSLAHFWDGYTGLTVTVLSIATLFVLMQLTGRVDWEQEFKNARR
ncbi:MAG: hypothetical protein ACI8RZ_004123 [Myxococcota bacterium]|jgi:hypothetical protein